MVGISGQIKTIIFSVLFFFLALFLFTKFLGPISFEVNNVNTNKSDLFQTTGSGKETTVPDTAQISIGITQTSATVEDAKSKADKIANKVVADLKSLGIAEKDIETTNYSVSPNNTETTQVEPATGAETNAMMPIRPPQQNGYTVVQNIDVKIKPIERANQAINIATADGANLLGGVNYVVNDDTRKVLEQKARIKAVADAKQKATDLANAAGIKLGKIINITEDSGGYPYPLMAASAKTDQAGEGTNLNPGETTIQIQVTLTFETL